MKEQAYKSPNSVRYSVDVLVWLFIFGIPLAIWWDEYRWKIMFTALFSFLIVVILVLSESANEKKYNEKHTEKIK